MKIILNGKETLVEAQNLQDLVNEQKLNPDRVVIELNETIVKHENWSQTTLNENDRVEIVGFMGGG